MGEDGELGGGLASRSVGNDKSGLGSRVGVEVKGDTSLTTVVLGSLGVQGCTSCCGSGRECLGDSGGEVLSGDSLTNNSNVGLGEGRLGELLDGIKSYWGVGGCVDRVTETTTESNLVSGVDGLGYWVGGGGLGLTLDGGENEL